jgi:hypothetical protein
MIVFAQALARSETIPAENAQAFDMAHASRETVPDPSSHTVYAPLAMRKHGCRRVCMSPDGAA